MKTNQKNVQTVVRKHQFEGVPTLKFGHPRQAVHQSADPGNSLLGLGTIGSITPFDQISNDLYNQDYENRILVIDEDIDEKCFIYAKAIENWNREDKKIFDLKSRIKNLIDKFPETQIFFRLVRIKIDDVESCEAKTEELQAQADALVEKHPELESIFITLQEVNISQYEILDYESVPIKIKINSMGGLILCYQTLADVILLSKIKVIGINMGIAYSAAAFLLVSCHERWALSKSRMMIHRGFGGSYGTYEQTESSQKNYSKIVDEMICSCLKRSKITRSDLQKRMNPDWYFSSEEALKYGLIDKIVDNIDVLL